MKFRTSNRSGVIDIISLLLVYAILVSTVLVFSTQIVRNVSFATSLPTAFAIFLMLLVPAALLAMIGANVVRLIRDRARRKPGIRLKTKIIGYFFIILILASIPQAVLLLNFIDTTVDSWFSSKTGDAISGGLSLAIEYYREKLDRLQAASESELPGLVTRYLNERPDALLERVRQRYPEISAMQVFDKDGGTLWFEGMDDIRMSGGVIANLPDGFLPKEAIGSLSLVRYLKNFKNRVPEKSIVMTIMLPEGFDKTAESLTKAQETASQIEKFRPTFKYVVIIFYGIFTLPMLLISILLSFLLSNEIIFPIVNLEEATKKVADGDLSVRILTKTNDELSILTRSFNRMVFELERSRSTIIQTERINIWQDIAQRLAHEIKNPLTPIKLSAERVLRRLRNDPGRLQEILEPAMLAIIQETDNMNALLTEFKSFARLPEPQFEWTNLRYLVEETARPYLASHPRVSIEYDRVDPELLLSVDRNHFRQLLTNLFGNSIDAMNGVGILSLRTDLVKKTNSRYCRLQVRDTGSGIPLEIRDKIFTPYFTTKMAGTGLGLSIVEHIVIDHKGEIWFESAEGAGTTFFIDLPMDS